mgnify:CR=1 FL=1
MSASNHDQSSTPRIQNLTSLVHDIRQHGPDYCGTEEDPASDAFLRRFSGRIDYSGYDEGVGSQDTYILSSLGVAQAPGAHSLHYVDELPLNEYVCAVVENTDELLRWEHEHQLRLRTRDVLVSSSLFVRKGVIDDGFLAPSRMLNGIESDHYANRSSDLAFQLALAAGSIIVCLRQFAHNR